MLAALLGLVTTMVEVCDCFLPLPGFPFLALRPWGRYVLPCSPTWLPLPGLLITTTEEVCVCVHVALPGLVTAMEEVRKRLFPFLASPSWLTTTEELRACSPLWLNYNNERGTCVLPFLAYDNGEDTCLLPFLAYLRQQGRCMLPFLA